MQKACIRRQLNKKFSQPIELTIKEEKSKQLTEKAGVNCSTAPSTDSFPEPTVDWKQVAQGAKSRTQLFAQLLEVSNFEGNSCLPVSRPTKATGG